MENNYKVKWKKKRLQVTLDLMKFTEDTTGRRSVNAAMLGENVIWMLDKGEKILRNWHAWNHFYKAIFKDICSSNVTDPQG